MNGEDSGNSIIEEENEDQNEETSGDGEHILWSIGDLLKGLRLLTDNFAAFKAAGQGLKVPTVK
jgi:hypothetical protein